MGSPTASPSTGTDYAGSVTEAAQVSHATEGSHMTFDESPAMHVGSWMADFMLALIMDMIVDHDDTQSEEFESVIAYSPALEVLQDFVTAQVEGEGGE
jgi:hypothetical protein